jgi:hypothetical protein
MAEETILVRVVLEAGEYKAEVDKISQVSGTAEKAVSGLEESTKGLGAQLQRGVGLSEFKKGADEVTASLKNQNNAIKEEIAVQKQSQSEAQKTGANKASLTSRVKELRTQLVQLELAGKRDTEEFKKLSLEAAKLKDAIGDVSQRTKNLASDTKNFDAFAQGIQGIAGGFAAAQGVAALFGKENENVQKALLKVQATMAIVNGLQAVFNTLNKDSAFLTIANAKASGIASAAMRLFGVTVNTTSFAFKALRTAIIATGIGAIVAVIATLASKMDSLSGSTKESTDNFKELNKQLEDFKNKTNDIISKELQATLNLQVEKGELNELEAKRILLNKQLQKDIADAKTEEIEKTDEIIKSTQELITADLERLNVLQKRREEVNKLRKNKIEEGEEEKKLRLSLEKTIADSDKKILEFRKEKEKQVQSLASTTAKVIATEELKVENAKNAKIKAESDKRREREKQEDAKRLADQKKFLDEFEKLTVDSFNKTLDEEGRLNQENFVKRRALIDAFEKLTNKEKLEKKEELDAALLLLEEELQDKITKLRLEEEKKTAAEIAKIRQQQTNDTLLNIDTEASKRRRQGKENLKDDLKDNDDKLAAILETFEGSEAEKANLIEKSEENASNIRKKYADIDAAYAQEVFNSSLQLTNALFSLQASLRQKALDDIQKQRELELRNFQGTEEEKARIEEKFAAKEKQARIKAVQQERDRAIFEATIQAALNILKAGVDPLLIALAVTTAAVQIAAIKSAPLPTFEKGGKVEGKSHRLGGTIIEAERDEFVVNKKAVRKHEPFIEAINKADGSFERMVFDKFVFPKIADLSPSQATILKATFKSDKIEKELRMNRKADQKNTSLLAGILQSEKYHSQSDRYKW